MLKRTMKDGRILTLLKLETQIIISIIIVQIVDFILKLNYLSKPHPCREIASKSLYELNHKKQTTNVKRTYCYLY